MELPYSWARKKVILTWKKPGEKKFQISKNHVSANEGDINKSDHDVSDAVGGDNDINRAMENMRVDRSGEPNK